MIRRPMLRNAPSRPLSIGSGPCLDGATLWRGRKDDWPSILNWSGSTPGLSERDWPQAIDRYEKAAVINPRAADVRDALAEASRHVTTRAFDPPADKRGRTQRW